MNLPCVEYVKCPRGGFVQPWYCEQHCEGVWVNLRDSSTVDCPHEKERTHSRDYPLRLEEGCP